MQQDSSQLQKRDYSSLVTFNQGLSYFYFKQLLNEEKKSLRDELIGKYYESKQKLYNANQGILDENLKGKEWKISEHLINGNKYYGFVHQNIITLEQLLSQLNDVKLKIEDQKNVKNQEQEKIKQFKQDEENLIALLDSLINLIIEEFISLNQRHFNINSENILVAFQKPCFYSQKTLTKFQVIFINFDQSDKSQALSESEGYALDHKQIIQILQKVCLSFPKNQGELFQKVNLCSTVYSLKQLKEEFPKKSFKILKFECLNKWDQQKLNSLNGIFNQEINEDVFLPISALNGIFLQNQFLNSYDVQQDIYKEQIEMHQNLVRQIKTKQQEYLDYQEEILKQEQKSIGKHFKFEIQFDELKVYQSLFSNNLFESLVEYQNFDEKALSQVQNKILQIFESSKNEYLEILQEYSRLQVSIQSCAVSISLI